MTKGSPKRAALAACVLACALGGCDVADISDEIRTTVSDGLKTTIVDVGTLILEAAVDSAL